MKWIGVDVGGTFTDIVVYDARAGAIRSTKSPSTPDDPTRGVLAGLAASGVSLAGVSRFATAPPWRPTPRSNARARFSAC